MGTDIYASSAVIMQVDDLVDGIKAKNKKEVIQKIKLWHENQCEDEARSYFAPLADIKPTMKLGDLREILCGLVQVDGEPAKYETEISVRHSDEIWQLWNWILDAIDEGLPGLTSVEAFGSGRYNGWDVPLGVACFMFADEDCFERVLTDEGQRLKKLTGFVETTTWTEISY